MPSYPYISGQNGLVEAFHQFRKAGFPAKVDASYLKRFKIASANESYLIAILRFLGMVDDDGAKVDENVALFYGADDAFQTGLKARMQDAYSQVFDEMGREAAFTTDRTSLATWFRGVDKTSELVGGRQASTFLTLASLAMGSAVPKPRASQSGASHRRAKRAIPANAPAPQAKSAAAEVVAPPVSQIELQAPDVGLTVRIEVNLPAGEDPATYDAIFASIKQHLMP